MKPTKSPCQLLRVADALKKLPDPEGKRFATIFEHGTLAVEIYAPRGTDPQQPHTRDEVYFVTTGSGEYVAEKAARHSDQLIYCSRQPESRIVLKTLLMINSMGLVLWTGGRRTCRKLRKSQLEICCPFFRCCGRGRDHSLV